MCTYSDAIEERGIYTGLRKGRRQGRREGRKQGLKAMIETCKEIGCTRELTGIKIQEKFGFSQAAAEQHLNTYWK